MKKIIFLFILFLALVPTDVSAYTILECDGSSFEINRDAGSLVITKRGENPFMKTYNYEGRSSYVSGVTCVDGMYTFYGFTSTGDDINYYDTLLFTMDEDGELIFEDAEDFGGNEEAIGAAWVDQVLFGIFRVDDLGDRWNDIDPAFDYTVVKTYDVNHTHLETHLLDNRVIKFETTEDLLLLHYSYDDNVDLGIDTSMNLYQDNDIFDIKTKYDGEMELSYINDGKLNGTTMVNGLYIDYPGIYKFQYKSQSYPFIVHPFVEGVEHLTVYNTPITPLISSGNYTLNNELYISGTEISTPGNYELVIHGANEYQQLIQFTITPQVEGVINGHDYEDPFVITFEGEGYLNNSLVTSPVQIEEVGDYILRVNGVGGFSNQYEFTFSEDEGSFSARDLVQKIDILIVIVAVVIGVIIVKKK